MFTVDAAVTQRFLKADIIHVGKFDVAVDENELLPPKIIQGHSTKRRLSK